MGLSLSRRGDGGRWSATSALRYRPVMRWWGQRLVTPVTPVIRGSRGTPLVPAAGLVGKRLEEQGGDDLGLPQPGAVLLQRRLEMRHVGHTRG